MVMQIKTVDKVIDALGGTHAVAQMFGVPDHHVSNWRRRGFPPETFVAFRDALREIDADAPPSLWRMRETVADTSDRPF